MSGDIEEIVENLNTIQDFTDIVRDPRISRANAPRFEQRGGLMDVLGMVRGIFEIIFKILIGILLFLKELALQLFWIPWSDPNRALFWKYIWFCIKCGFYLLVFGIAGPIFMVIGISIVYSKMFAKMGTDGTTLVRERLSAARDL